MNKKNIYSTIVALVIITPIISFAALDGIKGLITSSIDIINLLIPVVFGLAILFFFWGVAQFILHSDQEDAREDGKQRMLWGVVALFVIASIYGILGFIGDSIGIKPSSSLNTSGSGLCPSGQTEVSGNCI